MANLQQINFHAAEIVRLSAFVPQPSYITTRDALQEAMDSAKGGEVFDLSGHFGELTLSGERPFTLRGGEFSRIHFDDVHGIGLHGVRCTCEVSARGGGDLVFDGCTIAGPSNFGLVLRGVHRVKVLRCLIRDHAIDDVRVVAGCRDVLVEDCAIINNLDAGGAHKDLFQMFGIRGQGIPRGVTIRRCFMYSNPPKSARQGLFITDPNNGEDVNSFSDIVVEQNFIHANNKNTLVVTWGDESCTAQHNTLKGSGNLLVNGKLRTTGNLVNQAGNGLPNSDGDVIYKGKTGIFTGTDMRWEHFAPQPGFVADGVGCVELVAHLKAGQPHGLDLWAA